MTRSHHFTLIAAVAASLLSIQLLTATTADNESARQENRKRPLPIDVTRKITVIK